MPTTFWLASYPKSGNTWVRIFLANLLFPDQRPLELNDLPLVTTIASSRSHFDRAIGVPSALLTAAEIAALRPEADRAFRHSPQSLQIRKVHDAFTWLPDGRPLLGRGPDFAALYILRDPWDVAVSTAHHFSMALDQAVDRLVDTKAAVATGGRGLSAQLPQQLLSWSGHVLSWLHAPMSVHVIRYEEMKHDPLPVFRSVVQFLRLEFDDRAIADALQASDFEHLQRQERARRFRETGPKAPSFFRRGTVGEGLAALTPSQLARLSTMKTQVAAALGLDAAL